jgi:hypothetical protein
MIKKIVFAFGPPKCGMKAVGQCLLRNHGWSHTCTRRSLAKFSEVFMLDGMEEIHESGEPLPDDVAFAAFAGRMVECARIDSGKCLFYHGAFANARQLVRIVEYSACFTKEIRILEFTLPPSDALDRMTISNSAHLSVRENAVGALESYCSRLVSMRKSVKLASKSSRRNLVLDSLDGRLPAEDLARMIVRAKIAAT